jgi:dienelactone hydrolase
MNHRSTFTLLAVLLALVALSGCIGLQTVETTTPPAAATVAATEAAEPTAAATEAEPTVAATAVVEPTAAATEVVTTATTEPIAEAGGDLPPAVFYDLGETTLVQDNFAADSRFRNMPARLNGVMATPTGEGSFPVVLVLHGTHPGCPVVGEVDVWPCDIEVEQRNYAGFEYLVRELAARGYVTLAPNINAEFTFGFGEPIFGVRLRQLLDQHLRALATAAGGGANDFGVELAGVADIGQLILIGHSQGGEAANRLTRQYSLNAPETAAELGYGPVAGLLLVAPALNNEGSDGSDVPLAVILPACDGDVMGLDGQHYYEAVRFQVKHTWATTALLEAANHNGFNTILGGDMVNHSSRPACQPLLTPAAQQQFLVEYAADFLTAVLDKSPEAQAAALARLGLDVSQPAPTELYGRPARVNFLPAVDERLALFALSDEAGVTTNALGGAVTSEGATLFYCPAGFTVEPELAPCRRPNTTIPGSPALAVVSWPGPAALKLALPAGAGDLSGYTTLTLRAVIDPLSDSNAADTPQSFSVRLTDGRGATASVVVGPNEPALQTINGEFREDDFFPPGILDAIVHMTTVRVPLASFTGVDLGDITEVALVFDQTVSGTLFVADVEVAR